MNIHGVAWALEKGRRLQTQQLEWFCVSAYVCAKMTNALTRAGVISARNNMMPVRSEKQIFSRYLAGKVLPCCHDNSGFIIIGSSEQLVDVGQVVHTRCVA